MHRLFPVLVLILIPMLSGCNIKNDSQSRVYKGYYWHNFEESRFSRLCHADRWWMTGKMDKLVRFIVANMNDPRTRKSVLPVYVEVKATLSSKGKWGHLGGYTRRMDVSQVLSFSRTGKGSPERKCRP